DSSVRPWEKRTDWKSVLRGRWRRADAQDLVAADLAHRLGEAEAARGAGRVEDGDDRLVRRAVRVGAAQLHDAGRGRLAQAQRLADPAADSLGEGAVIDAVAEVEVHRTALAGVRSGDASFA